jgi:hypothetical protein
MTRYLFEATRVIDRGGRHKFRMDAMRTGFGDRAVFRSDISLSTSAKIEQEI